MAETPFLDAYGAVDRGAYLTLKAAITDVGVYQHVTKDTPPPFIFIGDQDNARKLGGKGTSRSRAIPLSIVVVTEGESRKPCGALLGRAERALDDVTITIPGWKVTFAFDQSAATLTEDGSGFVGLAQFNAFAIAD